MQYVGWPAGVVGLVLALAGSVRAAGDQPLDGKKLLLNATPRLEVLSIDRRVHLGDGAGSADDPTLAGGSLRLVGAGGLDVTYPLAPAGWAPISRKKAEKGWKYRADAPIKKVLVKAGKQIKILGKGASLAFTLEADHDPVAVVLTLGTQRYCLSFGGTPNFKPGKKYLAKKAPAPATCPSDGTTTTTTTSTTTTTTVTTIPACTGEPTLIVNGCFDEPVLTSPSNGWSFENQDGAGGWEATCGNPGGCFRMNASGQLATDPTVSQVVSGLTTGVAYRLSGEYRSIYGAFGDPAKPDAFAARVDPQPLDHASTVVLALPRPIIDEWTGFSVDFTASAADVTITFEAERGGDDSSFAIDNVALREVP